MRSRVFSCLPIWILLATLGPRMLQQESVPGERPSSAVPAEKMHARWQGRSREERARLERHLRCLLYTSDAADE